MTSETVSKYFKQGLQAQCDRKPRESCRYRAEAIVTEWVRGWDAGRQRDLDREARANTPRWTDVTSRYQDTRDTPATAWQIQGKAPWVWVSADAKEYGVSIGPRVTCHAWGIEKAHLVPGADLDDPDQVQRAAIQTVREVLEARLAELDRAAEALGQAPR